MDFQFADDDSRTSRGRDLRSPLELSQACGTRTQSLLDDLVARGAVGLDDVAVRRTASRGLGVFAGTSGIAPGGLIARIPRSSTLSIARSRASTVGLACAALAHQRDPSPRERKRCRVDGGGAAANSGTAKAPRGEFVMWLDMAVARRDVKRSSHPYLASLPAAMPDCGSWPAALTMRLLAGTNLGAAAVAARARLTADVQLWLPKLRDAAPHLFARCTEEDVRWARSMYFSRRFPVALLGAAYGREDDGEEGGGIMLPFFDLLNHDECAVIAWVAATDSPADAGAATVDEAGQKHAAGLLRVANVQRRLDEHTLQHGSSERDHHAGFATAAALAIPATAAATSATGTATSVGGAYPEGAGVGAEEESAGICFRAGPDGVAAVRIIIVSPLIHTMMTRFLTYFSAMIIMFF